MKSFFSENFSKKNVNFPLWNAPQLQMNAVESTTPSGSMLVVFVWLLSMGGLSELLVAMWEDGQ